MKLLVSDFDRTLYNDRAISPENLAALEKWKRAGHLFAVATGRNRASVTKNLDAYSLSPDYLISNNGAVVHRGDERLFCRHIGGEAALAIARVFYETYGESMWISALEKNALILSAPGEQRMEIEEEIVPFERVESLGAIIQFSVKFATEAQARRACDFFNAEFADDIEAYVNETSIDVGPKGTNKAEGVEFVQRDRAGIEQVVVVGDSYNDVEMIRRYAGYTLEHAGEDIRKIAAFVKKDVSGVILEHL